MNLNNAVFDCNQSIKSETILCLQTLFSIPEGTQPLDRSFGINSSILDQPLDIAQNLFTLEAIEKVEKYIPEVEVDSVNFEVDVINGKLTPYIKLKAVKSGGK